jgi:hypothetical protein
MSDDGYGDIETSPVIDTDFGVSLIIVTELTGVWLVFIAICAGLCYKKMPFLP